MCLEVGESRCSGHQGSFICEYEQLQWRRMGVQAVMELRDTNSLTEKRIDAVAAGRGHSEA